MLEVRSGNLSAKLLVEKHQYALSVNKSYRAVLAAAKGLLVTEGIGPRNRCRKRSRNLISGWRSRASCRHVRQPWRTSRDLGSRMPAPRRPQEKMAFQPDSSRSAGRHGQSREKDLKLAQVKRGSVADSASSRWQAGRAGIDGTGVRLARRRVR